MRFTTNVVKDKFWEYFLRFEVLTVVKMSIVVF
jgi:hypothetical protein